MTEKDPSKKRIVPDLLKMKNEYLFRTIGGDGKLSLEVKCLFLGLILLIPGLVVNFCYGTHETYIIDGWGHFVATLFVGLFAWFLVRFVGRIDERIRHVNQIISPPRKEEDDEGYKEWRSGAGYQKLKDWEERIEKYKNWVLRLESHKWYYFDAIGGAACGFVLGMLLIRPEHTWVHGNFFTMLYLRAWYIFYGFFIGSCLHYIFGGYNAIRQYCKNVVSHEEIFPLNPDHTGGLRELGRLSLDLDLVVAIPSIGFPMFLLRFKLFELLGREAEIVDIQSEIQIAIVLSILYAIVLMLVFFGSISPAHDAMVEAKNNYLLKVHGEYRDLHEELLNKLDTKRRVEPKEYSTLSGLHDLYEKVQSMAVWPLDFRTTIRFSLTSLLPLISVGITVSI